MSPEPQSPPKVRPSALPAKHLYDAIVIGSQIGGLVAAALLSKRGYRVLHVDHDGLGAGYQEGDYALPYAPSVLPSLKTMPGADRVLTELGYAMDLQRAMEPLTPDLQVLMPRNRLDLPRDAAERSREAEREFGMAGKAVAQHMERVQAYVEATDPFFQANLPFPPEGFFERRQLRKAVSACPQVEDGLSIARDLEKHPLGEALRSLSRFFGYLDDPSAGGLSLLRPLGQGLKGTYSLPGGADGLSEALRARLPEAGCDLLGEENAPSVVEQIAFDGRLAAGIKVAGSDNIYRARMLIGATDAPALRRLFPAQGRHRKFVEALEKVRARAFLFSVNFVLKREGLPLGLGELAFTFPSAAPLGPLLVQVNPARKAKTPVEGEVVLSAAAFVPPETRGKGEAHLRQLAEQITAAVQELVPFLDRYLILRSVPHLTGPGARAVRLMPHPLFEVELPQKLGVTGLPQRTPYKNVFLASREVLPGLGLEGEFMAGARAAELVQDALNRRDPLKKG